ncbi:hypothetical protein F4805DRAFT_417248 [Annulohypoxylon moriforme]|nr:hypothetical protein F4805DRAFT_417248 [Annulohypoxylon moriforme]
MRKTTSASAYYSHTHHCQLGTFLSASALFWHLQDFCFFGIRLRRTLLAQHAVWIGIGVGNKRIFVFWCFVFDCYFYLSNQRILYIYKPARPWLWPFCIMFVEHTTSARTG